MCSKIPGQRAVLDLGLFLQNIFDNHLTFRHNAVTRWAGVHRDTLNKGVHIMAKISKTVFSDSNKAELKDLLMQAAQSKAQVV